VKKQLKPLVTVMCLLGCATLPMMASAAVSNAAMQAQLNTLQQEVATLQQELHAKPHRIAAHRVKRLHAYAAAPQSPASHAQAAATQPSSHTGDAMTSILNLNHADWPVDLDAPGESAVSTGPYVGTPVQYSGFNLVVNSPSVNTDVQLLDIRKEIDAKLAALAGGSYINPYHSHVLLSGIVEAQADYFNHSGPNNGGVPSSNIDVTNVSLDTVLLGPSQWALAFAEFTYDNAAPTGSPYTSTSNYTDINSRLYVNKAFITVGNFTQTPFYGTVGQEYVPFGSYTTLMVSTPLTESLARTKARAIELGARGQASTAPYAAIYVFRGDAHTTAYNHINNGGVDLGYKITEGSVTADIGGGVIGNIAESVGSQLGVGFQNNELIAHRVPAYNARANVGVGDDWDFIGEYVESNEFSANDVTYNGHGAQPSSFDLEAAYSIPVFGKPSSIVLGYAQSRQAMAWGIPFYRESVVLDTSLWRDTLESLEFRHDREYAAGDTATGPIGAPVIMMQTGKYDNAITAQFDYYF